MSSLQSQVVEHWRYIAAVLIVATVVVGLGAWKLYVELSDPNKPNQDQHTHAEHKGTITQDITSIMLQESGQKTASNDNKKPSKATSEQIYSYTKSSGDPDLAAQRGMWKAANALVWLTFGQIFIGLITIGLVGGTFCVQKGELNETKKANRLQIQPYLAIKDYELIWKTDWETGQIDKSSPPLSYRKPYIVFKFSIENRGFSDITRISSVETTGISVVFEGINNDIPYVTESPMELLTSIQNTTGFGSISAKNCWNMSLDGFVQFDETTQEIPQDIDNTINLITGDFTSKILTTVHIVADDMFVNDRIFKLEIFQGSETGYNISSTKVRSNRRVVAKISEITHLGKGGTA